MPRRTHEDAMQTKQSILDAALEVFSRYGYEKSSLSDVAREAKVTRGAIYWHFEDKSELLCELCKSIASRHELTMHLFEASDPMQEDPLGELKRWCMFHASDNSIQFLTSTIFIEIDSLAHARNQDPKVNGRLQEMYNSLMVYLRDALQNAITRQQLPPDFDIDAGIIYISSLLFGFCSMVREHDIGQTRKIRELAGSFRQIVEVTFTALPQLRRGMLL